MKNVKISPISPQSFSQYIKNQYYKLGLNGLTLDWQDCLDSWTGLRNLKNEKINQVNTQKTV